jgi:hypothetical protein
MIDIDDLNGSVNSKRNDSNTDLTLAWLKDEGLLDLLPFGPEVLS